ncbi:hypothetical protein CXF59_12340 [Flavobacterium sp. ALD4]|uniref:hypothetical protein n=1 Tax=Flavobacterium sp. ALD4 TaxID=2058314 RepID=UPI000C33D16A|nr:hypothetical protein [Flavobacterium sp. ALD4]PKH66707.1 hypothetical protein CXF59_12340 [Flavobacterium sp. ALD4]
MKNNKIKNLIFIVLFSSMLLFLYLLYAEMKDDKLLIESLRQEMKLNDSLSDYKIKKYAKIIETNNYKFDSLNNSKNSVRGFTIGNKSISIDELLNIANNALEANSRLQNEVANDSLILKKIEENYGIKTYRDSKGKIVIQSSSQSKNDPLENSQNEKIIKLSNELDEKKFILNNLQKRYNFKYDVKTEKDKIKSTIYVTKLDSALWLYPYYKHKIKEDKKGNIIIK